nr:hypothetical protein CFP56_00706 [Quercus suber]
MHLDFCLAKDAMNADEPDAIQTNGSLLPHERRGRVKDTLAEMKRDEQEESIERRHANFHTTPKQGALFCTQKSSQKPRNRARSRPEERGAHTTKK